MGHVSTSVGVLSEFLWEQLSGVAWIAGLLEKCWVKRLLNWKLDKACRLVGSLPFGGFPVGYSDGAMLNVGIR